ncbi:MAG: iron-sulfur cluster assembly protein [Bacteroidota bacterium]
MMENENYLEMEGKVIDALKNVFDPEIPVNIYDLGLIYEISTSDAENQKKDVKVLMTLTSPNCPIAEDIPVTVRDEIKKIEGVNEVVVEMTFEPPWTEDLMTDAAKLELGFL